MQVPLENWAQPCWPQCRVIRTVTTAFRVSLQPAEYRAPYRPRVLCSPCKCLSCPIASVAFVVQQWQPPGQMSPVCVLSLVQALPLAFILQLLQLKTQEPQSSWWAWVCDLKSLVLFFHFCFTFIDKCTTQLWDTFLAPRKHDSTESLRFCSLCAGGVSKWRAGRTPYGN